MAPLRRNAGCAGSGRDGESATRIGSNRVQYGAEPSGARGYSVCGTPGCCQYGRSVVQRVLGIRRSRLTLCLLFVSALGCTQKSLDIVPPKESENVVAPVERLISVRSWDTVWSIAGGSRGQDGPVLIQARDSTCYVYDQSSRTVAAYNARGRVLWRSGPIRMDSTGGTLFIRDMKVSNDGSLLLLDSERSTVVSIEANGQKIHEIRLEASERPSQIVPMSRSRIMAVPELDSVFSVFDSQGRRIGRATVPWPTFARLHPLVRQGLTSVDASGTWVFAFRFGDGWFAFDTANVVTTRGRYAEHHAFPRVRVVQTGQRVSAALAQYTPCTACSVSLADSTLYVLAGGSSATLRRLVDRFDLHSGRYLESYRLPEIAERIAVSDGTIYALARDSTNRVVALRPHQPELAARMQANPVTKWRR